MVNVFILYGTVM